MRIDHEAVTAEARALDLKHNTNILDYALRFLLHEHEIAKPHFTASRSSWHTRADVLCRISCLDQHYSGQRISNVVRVSSMECAMLAYSITKGGCKFDVAFAIKCNLELPAFRLVLEAISMLDREW